MSKDIYEQYFEEELEVLAILKKGWSSIAYNPKGKYSNICFTVEDGEDIEKINKWLGLEEEKCQLKKKNNKL